ncbi:mRNA-decapping enzyme 2, putative [Plasmodium berghei]|uniref:mRNA-decapping enzyme 2, putative n=2 Tax=Plasmodium berghei TaxID=5821 RepID=A0A509ARD3_PLABA|nr:mRNA-decapping enzyme 2, putative [Plasmodium berghei ANKA]SCM26034.1 mRNA-decapping enzyme 2, putative [Plasmodium berghei]SCN28244.1 mRNA-decapping enzyme 2, putative [Plasmodium berghei]SCO62442.1 mRNA-decapping enzyme 2, putative [Plasmodium berghei]SCO64000.1 mRNA-decapping enzyme 2, putative [Plasmodium berghei]VUC58133.1 mRNA-decapping enzyme 2, putative [Plasmodium berghei ANKA]|eukprot:XP_034423896.1 mRNA-decapping enzyme 2, putative [Plasmodium berghei ANKA]
MYMKKDSYKHYYKNVHKYSNNTGKSKKLFSAQRIKNLAKDKKLLDDALLDCYGRFIALLPEFLLKDHVHLYFQIQEAYWWYDDMWQDKYPDKLPKLSLKTFGYLICDDCPILKKYVPPSAHEKFSLNWRRYCRTIPLRGAILLNHNLKKCLLVKGWSTDNWSFPKGKIDELEEDSVCACREIYEEIGIDIFPYIDEQVYIETHIEDQPIKLFIIPGVKEDTQFQPKTRKEIGAIRWFEIEKIEKFFFYKNYKGKGYNLLFDNKKERINASVVCPFIPNLIKWIGILKKCINGKSLDENAYVSSSILSYRYQITGIDANIIKSLQKVDADSTEMIKTALPKSDDEYFDGYYDNSEYVAKDAKMMEYNNKEQTELSGKNENNYNEINDLLKTCMKSKDSNRNIEKKGGNNILYMNGGKNVQSDSHRNDIHNETVNHTISNEHINEKKETFPILLEKKSIGNLKIYEHVESYSDESMDFLKKGDGVKDYLKVVHSSTAMNDMLKFLENDEQENSCNDGNKSEIPKIYNNRNISNTNNTDETDDDYSNNSNKINENKMGINKNGGEKKLIKDGSKALGIGNNNYRDNMIVANNDCKSTLVKYVSKDVKGMDYNKKKKISISSNGSISNNKGNYENSRNSRNVKNGRNNKHNNIYGYNLNNNNYNYYYNNTKEYNTAMKGGNLDYYDRKYRYNFNKIKTGHLSALRLKEVGLRSFDDQDIDKRKKLHLHIYGNKKKLYKTNKDLYRYNQKSMKTGYKSLDDESVHYMQIKHKTKDACNDKTFGYNHSNGWSPEDMFKLNEEKFGVHSTYNIDKYTTPLIYNEECESQVNKIAMQKINFNQKLKMCKNGNDHGNKLITIAKSNNIKPTITINNHTNDQEPIKEGTNRKGVMVNRDEHKHSLSNGNGAYGILSKNPLSTEPDFSSNNNNSISNKNWNNNGAEGKEVESLNNACYKNEIKREDTDNNILNSNVSILKDTCENSYFQNKNEKNSIYNSKIGKLESSYNSNGDIIKGLKQKNEKCHINYDNTDEDMENMRSANEILREQFIQKFRKEKAGILNRMGSLYMKNDVMRTVGSEMNSNKRELVKAIINNYYKEKGVIEGKEIREKGKSENSVDARVCPESTEDIADRRYKLKQILNGGMKNMNLENDTMNEIINKNIINKINHHEMNKGINNIGSNMNIGDIMTVNKTAINNDENVKMVNRKNMNIPNINDYTEKIKEKINSQNVEYIKEKLENGFLKDNNSGKFLLDLIKGTKKKKMTDENVFDSINNYNKNCMPENIKILSEQDILSKYYNKEDTKDDINNNIDAVNYAINKVGWQRNAKDEEIRNKKHDDIEFVSKINNSKNAQASSINTNHNFNEIAMIEKLSKHLNSYNPYE